MKVRKFKWKDAEHDVGFTHYPADGSPVWYIGDISSPNRQVLTVCAIDLGFDPPAPGYLYIKDWNEGAGVAAAMVEQGILELVTRIDINGHGSKLAIMRVPSL
jgi:hypothetical protein